MGYEFEWFNRELGAMIVTIAEYGLTFNRAAIEALGRPEMVVLGFDRRKHVIGVKPISRSITDSEKHGFLFAGRERNGFVRINSKDFIRNIKPFLPGGLLNSAKRCVAVMDEVSGVLTVDINNVITDGEGNEVEQTEDKS